MPNQRHVPGSLGLAAGATATTSPARGPSAAGTTQNSSNNSAAQSPQQSTPSPSAPVAAAVPTQQNSTLATTRQATSQGTSQGTGAYQNASRAPAGLTAGLTALLSTDFSDPENANTLPELSSTRLELSVSDGNFVAIQAHGLNDQRPEIIAQFDFEPVYHDNMQNAFSDVQSPVGELLDIQITSRQLRAENIVRLLNELKNDRQTASAIAELERKLNEAEAMTSSEIRFLREMVQKIFIGKRSLSVKFNEEGIRNELTTRDYLTPLADPIKHLMVNFLKFSENGYKSFTDTKILMQIIEDLRNVLRSFSPQLIDSPNNRRASDNDPFVINKIENGGSGRVFSISSLTSRASIDVQNILKPEEMTRFQDTLVTLSTPEDKIKLLFAILSKELRVSVGLSTPSVRNTAINAFGLTPAQIDNGIFDNILGEAGFSIFEQPSGPQMSLMNLLKIKTPNDTTIFPFEPTTIKRASQSILPGQKFYVDSILKGKEKFKTDDFRDFANVFSGRVAAVANIIEATTDVDVVNSERLGLNADDLFMQFLKIIQASVEEISTQNSIHDITLMSLMRLAADDVLLKHMITLYIVWVGTSAAQQQDSSSKFFTELAAAGDFTGQLRGIEDLSSTGNQSSSNAFLTAISLLQPSRQYLLDIVRLANVNVPIGSIPQPPTDFTGSSPLDIICQMIVDRVYKLTHVEGAHNGPSRRGHGVARPGQSAGSTGTNSVTESGSFLINRLMTLGAGDPSFLMRSIIEFINSIDARARVPLKGNSYFSASLPGLTKFNKIGAHTIVWIIVEIFTSFFKMYPVSTFAGSEKIASGDSSFVSTRDEDVITDVKLMLNEITAASVFQQSRNSSSNIANRILGNDTSRNRTASLQRNVEQLRSIMERFKKEDELIKKLTNTLMSIANNVRLASNDLVRFFDQAGSNAAAFASLKTSIDFNEKIACLDNAQITLSRNIIAEQAAIKQNFLSSFGMNSTAANASSVSPFIDDSTLTSNVKSTLFSLLRTFEFRAPAANNLRIISVGLPAGFLASMHERIGTFITGQSLQDFRQRYNLQNDVIKINVYMQDLLYENVVFKPKSFIFELGRFVSMPDFSDVKLDDTRDFEALVQNVIKTRAMKIDETGFTAETGSTIASDKSYDGVLTSEEKKQLAINHVKSYLLKLYIKLLTGVDLGEDNFYVNDSVADDRVDNVTKDLFKQIITSRVSGFAARRVTLDELKNSDEVVRDLLSKIDSDVVTSNAISPIQKIFKDASESVNVEVADDIVTFMKIFTPAAILTGAGARKVRNMSPKLFERIFNIVVDPDNFEIDHVATTSTSSGQSFLRSQAASRLIIPAEDKFIDSTGASNQSLNSIPIKFDPAVRREMGDVTLQQFFVTIEQVPELTPLQLNFIPNPPAITANATTNRTPIAANNAQQSENSSTSTAPTTASPTRSDVNEAFATVLGNMI